jgi:KUP system potassium uptake protein
MNSTRQPHRAGHRSVEAIALAAMGVVFGDIGTSPLYTLKTVLDLTGSHPTPATILGALSLVIWTLIIITTIKYVMVAMRVDNDGEGGIVALMSLLGVKHQTRPMIVAVGLFGAALIYGDGAITPAISVLSALEGLTITAKSLAPYVLPIAVIILVILFSIQSRGSGSIGRAFGPVMLLWFIVMAGLGIFGIWRHPAVLMALNPLWAISYLFEGGWHAFPVLGGVFLCVTGAEALYADMGHFGVKPIRLAWNAVVFPSLVLNYAGQAAIVLTEGVNDDNIFYRLCPSFLLLPLIVLATIATIIASQSIITGAFSMTRQAIQLGWLPRLTITQTSAEGYGQIYVSTVNWLLMIATIALCIGFGKSDNLAAAYGIAVSMTMLMTSALLLIAMREILHWSLLASACVAGGFLLVDSAFLASNSLKIANGGYVPLLLATAVYGLMWIWHRGASAVAARLHEGLTPIHVFLEKIKQERIARVPGTAVFLTRAKSDTAPVMAWHVKQNHALQEHVIMMTITVEPVPRISSRERATQMPVAPGFWRVAARYGFMERPNIPRLMVELRQLGCAVDLDNVTYYVGHETVTARRDGKGLPRWQEVIFAFMERNAAHITDYLALPHDRVVEIGRQVAI